MTEPMTLLEAAKWVDRNCTDETVKRIRSRAVAKVLFDEIRRQEELINDLAGVLWRLEHYGYIGHECEDEERDQCDHLRMLGKRAVEKVYPHKADKCKKCGGVMKPGEAIEQTYTGIPDFPGDKHCVTLLPGGSGKKIDCMKCEKCGWSTASVV